MSFLLTASVVRSHPVVRIILTLLGTLVFMLLVISLSAAEEKAETPPPPDQMPDMTAQMDTTLIDRSGHSSTTTAQIYRSGNRVRYEHRDADPVEVSIYDYSELREYRIFIDENYYFARDFHRRLMFRAQRMGLIPLPQQEEVSTGEVFLKEVRVNGHPSNLILRMRWLLGKKERGSEYTLVWEALDLENQVIRAAYYGSDLRMTIVNLKNITLQVVGPEFTEPPADYIGMNPF